MRGWRRLAGAGALLAVLGCVPASAQAAVVAGTTVTFPSSAFAGDTGLPATITLRNRNTNAEAGLANGVCNADDVGPPCATPEPGITLVPACKQVDASGCTPGGADPGVFAVSATATGRLGSACAGVTFTTAIVDPTFGTVRFSPPAGTRVVLAQGTSCEIDFTVDVLKAPVASFTPTLGDGPRQVTSHRQFGGPFNPASGSSRAQDATLFGTSLFRQWPLLNVTGSPSVTLGDQVSAMATVRDRRNPQAGATIDFRLYGPDDTGCAGAPVFESLGVPYPVAGGPVTSAVFTPTRAGLHRWLVTYSGDATNNPGLTGCGGAFSMVRAPAPSTAPATSPPTCSGKTATIVAKPGQRSIKGTAGADVIVGGALGERIDGRGGDDTICGGTGDDIVRGGSGNDLLLGGAGRDQLFGGSGNDRVRAARGGADRIDCGPGRGDSVLVDRLDRQTRCERVRR